MKELSALELSFIVKELSVLEGAKLDKIYNPEKNEFIFRFHVRNKGKKILRILLPNLLYLTELKQDYPEPSSFCMFLRKRLEKCNLVKIEQKTSERILEFIFEGKEKYTMIIEFFGSGNLILCKEDYEIISPLVSRVWKTRTVKKGFKYEYPDMKYDFFQIKLKEFTEMIENSNKDSVVKTLAIDLGVGGMYAEEICSIAKINKSKKKIMDIETKHLFEALTKLRKIKPSPSVILKNEKIADIIPVKLSKYEDYESKSHKSFNEALDFALEKEFHKKEDTKYTKQLEKIKTMIKKQEKTVKDLKVKEEENREKAELLYQKYQLVDEILKEIIKAREKYSWKEIKQKLKGHKVVKQINEKEGKIVLELE